MKKISHLNKERSSSSLTFDFISDLNCINSIERYAACHEINTEVFFKKIKNSIHKTLGWMRKREREREANKQVEVM